MRAGGAPVSPGPIADSCAPARPLGRMTRLLHWVVGLSVLGMLASGYGLAWTPSGPDKSAWVQVHKSFGVLVLAGALVRLTWRVWEGWPPALATHRLHERRAATYLYIFLIAATLAMPLSGIARSLAYGRSVAVFGWTLIPQLFQQKHEDLSAGFSGLHDGLAVLLAAAVGIHILAALKHHVVVRDETLSRMLALPSRPERER